MRLVSLFQVAVDMRRWPSAESGDYEIMVISSVKMMSVTSSFGKTMIS